MDLDGNVTKELGGITAIFGGALAPILYATPNQINLVAPFSLLPGTVRVELRRDGALVAAFDRAVSQTHPGLFTVNGLRYGPLAALNQDGSINSASNPAFPGSVVSLFATGLGAMVPLAIDGAIPQAPVNRPATPFSLGLYITLGGPYSPQLDYVGNAPGLVEGAIQINLHLPQSEPPDGIVTVLTANGGTIWVR